MARKKNLQDMLKIIKEYQALAKPNPDINLERDVNKKELRDDSRISGTSLIRELELEGDAERQERNSKLLATVQRSLSIIKEHVNFVESALKSVKRELSTTNKPSTSNLDRTQSSNREASLGGGKSSLSESYQSLRSPLKRK